MHDKILTYHTLSHTLEDTNMKLRKFVMTFIVPLFLFSVVDTGLSR